VTSNNADADAYQARSNATLAREEVGWELERLAKEQAESGAPTSACIRVFTARRHLQRSSTSQDCIARQNTADPDPIRSSRVGGVGAAIPGPTT
jgi:hypothetical protein